MQRNHDSKRVLPLVELILSLNIDPTSHAAKKLLFVSTLYSTYAIENTTVIRQIFCHPYKQVRNTIAANMNLVLQIQ